MGDALTFDEQARTRRRGHQFFRRRVGGAAQRHIFAFVLRAIRRVLADHSQTDRQVITSLWSIFDDPDLNGALDISQKSPKVWTRSERSGQAFITTIAESSFQYTHRNVAIEFRWADGHYGRLPERAADLVSFLVGCRSSIGMTSSSVGYRA